MRSQQISFIIVFIIFHFALHLISTFFLTFLWPFSSLQELLTDERLKVVRVRNAISVLLKMYMSISPDSITAIYLNSEKLNMHPKVRH